MTAWMQRAVCRDHNPELWFPTPGKLNEAAEAKRICRTCPVMDECFTHAVKTGQRFGIAGGRNMADPNNRKGRPSADVAVIARAHRLLAAGLTCREVAEQMKVSTRTVERYKAAVI